MQIVAVVVVVFLMTVDGSSIFGSSIVTLW